jgi:hypothetical protein
MIDVGLLRRLDEQFLELKTAPLHTDARACTGLERPDQSRSLFEQKLGRIFFLLVDIGHGHENENGYENDQRANDDPGRDAQPKFLFSSVRSVFHKMIVGSGYFLINWIPQMDTYYPLFFTKGCLTHSPKGKKSLRCHSGLDPESSSFG